ncbi:transcription factor VOZ1 isoform X2 [Cryptomeria japonica]|uniref:transcription factor VOZ1 isoform X2 n=1 Tax=Cryptomeria japonica TaxID=3369 RepID=UPI0027D9F797|nr:transcription factor VOZ1 isoform X2 [Cryptomeria japonica]
MEVSKGKRGSKWSSRQQFKNKAKNRVDDLQGIFTDLQQARKENRVTDAVVLEEQVHQTLREWKAELHEASPASSLRANSLSSSELSSDMKRLLQLHEEDDDASSNPKLQGGATDFQENDSATYQAFLDNELRTSEEPFERVSRCTNTVEGLHPNSYLQTSEKLAANIEENIQQHNYVQTLEQLPANIRDDLEVTLASGELNFHQDYIPTPQPTFALNDQEEMTCLFHDLQPGICPPPAAFLGPKCALWDCPRPARGTEWRQDYCSNFHRTLALNEGAPGRTPVLRPGGIELKDGPLFAALCAKTKDKAVGIPECEGAATSKSPWNAHELFDINILPGESVREWLFFDKPRRAFESGNRKQRSLPDYCGRGWHESRKQVMKDLGGLKRSYYMDPQPPTQFEWHLYEYEMNECDACALYRLELKLVCSKKNAKGKLGGDFMIDLQHQIGRLSAELSGETKQSNIGRIKIVKNNDSNYAYSSSNQITAAGEDFAYGTSSQCGYFVEAANGCYSTQ